MAISSIGPHNFISMSQIPSAPQQQLVLETRAGVDGTGIWRVGTAGTQFTVRTTVDVGTFAQATVKFREYEKLIGGGVYGISYGGVTASFLVAVLGVKPIDVDGTAIGVGGILGTSYGIVRAEWQLLPWEV